MNIKSQFTKKKIANTIKEVKKNHSHGVQKQQETEKKLIDKLKAHKAGKSSPPKRQHVSKYKARPHGKPKTDLRSSYKGKKLRVYAVGGYEEVGKNCTAIEYGDDIILIDLGFQFPDKDMLGVDYVLPDLNYIKKNKHKLRGLFITHGHLDHTGAIPYLIKDIGYPPIFGAQLTASLIKHRLEEFPEIQATIKNINPEKDKIKLGSFNIEFFRVNHNIPDAIGIVVHTPEGTVVHTGDYKFDFTPATDEPADLQRIAAIGSQGVTVLLSDSTNASSKGHTISEKDIGEGLDIAVGKCEGRIIAATFSTLLSRIQQIINSAYKHNRKVAFLGRSMLQNVEIATELKYFKLPPDTLVDPRAIKKLPDKNIVIIATGSQGQENSAVGRMATGDHRFIKLKKTDTVILSSSPVPGNENPITNMIDNIIRQGAKVIDNKSMDIHASGHGSAEDIKTMISLIKPKYLLPNHGSLSMRTALGQIGRDLRIPDDNIIMLDNGQSAEFGKHNLLSSDKKLESGLVFVDGLGVGDVGNVVIRDRQQLSVDGMITIIAMVKKGNIKTKDSDLYIISRGFVYMKEADPLMNKIKSKVLDIINHRHDNVELDLSSIKNRLRDELGEFIFRETKRRPMIMPAILEI